MIKLGMKLIVPRFVTDKARREAKRCFPKELYMDLAGVVDKKTNTTTITGYLIPSDLDKHNSKTQVNLQHSWEKEAIEYAKSINAEYVGSCHSHPYAMASSNGITARTKDCSPSEGDWQSEVMDRFSGILVICEDEKGKLTTRIRFYPPTTDLITYFKK